MYTKLFAKILQSSIWLEPDATRIVWITLLAAKDQDGFAAFSAIGSVANAARVSLEDARTAIATLEAPDPESANPGNDGRRIERVPGGWILLNAKEYDSIVTAEHARIQSRERSRAYRDRHAPSRNRHAPVTPLDIDVDVDKNQEAAQSASPPPEVPRETPKPARKGTRLDPEQPLPPAWSEIARGLGLAPESTYRKFLNYWVAKAGRDAAKLDWTRTFENWCLTELERLPGAPKPQAPAFRPSGVPMPKGRPSVAPGEPRFAKGFARG